MTPPLALYVHLPWCVRKCPYCDFNSHAVRQTLPSERYLAALQRDLSKESERATERSLVSVFFGGGTPSLFTATQIGRLIDVIAAEFSLCPDIEITMEANPGAVEHDDLAGYARAGVNRLSLGAQSFDPETLTRLGRIHGPEEIQSACESAAEAGFGSINLDLMFALPGQDMKLALHDVERATALDPAHISYYQLTLEPNTAFHAWPPADLPDEEQTFEIQNRCQALLAAAGYAQYEISAFAKPGFRCRHNFNYWTYGDYLGVGAGAHGKLTAEDGAVRRCEKPGNPSRYMKQAGSGSIDDGERRISAADIAFEYMMNALRLSQGFSLSDFVDRTGLPAECIRDGLTVAEERGLIRPLAGAGWQPTALGLRFHNDLVAIFLP